MTDPGPGRVPIGRSTQPVGARPRGRFELVPRVLSALVMAALAIATARIGGAVFSVFWLVAGAAVLWEWLGLVAGSRPLPALAIGGVALVASTWWATKGAPGAALLSLGVAAVLIAVSSPPGQRLARAAAPLYAGALVVSLPLLRQSFPDGFESVVWLFAVVWGTDTLAFFGGRLIGGPKLAPRLSPAKTWSGFVVGVGCGAVLGMLVAPHTGCRVCVGMAGLCGGALAQMGDLFESGMKRRFGVKDAGALIPGHGGVMDRLDGFIAASVFAAGVGLWRFGPMAAGSGLLKW